LIILFKDYKSLSLMTVSKDLRDNYIEILDTIVGKTYSTQIEQSIYNFALEYAKVQEIQYLVDSIYQTKADEIINLLKDKENYLLKAINKGIINVLNIGFMTPVELNPDKYNKILKIKKTEVDKINNQPTSNVYRCKKCKKNKCQVTQRQTRSADEPATTFVKCIECDYEFTIS